MACMKPLADGTPRNNLRHISDVSKPGYLAAAVKKRDNRDSSFRGKTSNWSQFLSSISIRTVPRQHVASQICNKRLRGAAANRRRQPNAKLNLIKLVDMHDIDLAEDRDIQA
ncbi:hypothetical protein EYR41_008531 [Orbilia oligospora]|uniref:Uncharacterized protein n=1 Tax=Orbilia oligospora TaxID=2813651 RepID=A0A8H2DXU4_ORBOL|nr:hypothetical protein EYR41_008531 [Orbilia oligospora]